MIYTHVLNRGRLGARSSCGLLSLGRPAHMRLLLEVSGDKRYLAQATPNAYGLNAASTR